MPQAGQNKWGVAGSIAKRLAHFRLEKLSSCSYVALGKKKVRDKGVRIKALAEAEAATATAFFAVLFAWRLHNGSRALKPEI